MAWSLLDQDEPEVLLLILVAGATPVMRPLQDQRWETFSGNWQTDVTIAFTWRREALLKGHRYDELRLLLSRPGSEEAR